MAKTFPVPRFSVVMPAFNTERFIGEAIQSVLGQTVTEWELIIVDDGSTDTTPLEAAKVVDARITYLRQANAGPAAARRFGAAKSAGSYIVFFDSDDRLRPEALQRLGEALDHHPNACVAYGDEVFMSEDGTLVGPERIPRFTPRPSGTVLEDILKRNFIFNGAACVRARCFGASNDSYDSLINEDWGFYCHMAATGDFIYIGGGPIMEYRLRKDSLVRKYGADLSATMEVIDHVFTSPRIVSRVAPKRLSWLKKKRKVVALAFSAKHALTARDWPAAFSFALRAIYLDLLTAGELLLPGILAQTVERRWRR